MTECETKTHSFVIKIWLEETREENGQVTWRGTITHIPGGEKKYIQSRDEIWAFIESFLIKLGIKPDRTRRLVQWLKSRKQQHKTG